MARIRTIKPEFWKHEALCEQPEATHMLAAALINYADDYGYFNANPKLIAGEIYPLREPSVSIPESLRRLQAIGYIRLGTGSDGRSYGHIVEFEKHQRVSHPTESKISKLTITWHDSGIVPEPLVNPPELFVPEQGTGKGKEQGKETLSAGADGVLFEEFWKAYSPPKNSKKPDAKRAWAVTSKLRPPQPDLLRAVSAYRAWVAEQSRKQNRDYPMQHPSTWLRGEVWNGFLSPSTGDGATGLPANLAELQAAEEALQRKSREEDHVH